MADKWIVVCSRALLREVLVFVCLLSTVGPLLAQEGWRPRDGVYGTRDCSGEGDDRVAIALARKSIAPYEQMCTVANVADTAPGTIEVNVACTDVDTSRPYTEVFVLKKIDDKKILLRETQDRKFTRPSLQIAYCPDKVQRAYSESQRKGR